MKKIVLFILISFPFIASGQNTLYFMDRLPQSTSFNPAFSPDINFHLELPGIGGTSATLYNSGFNYNEVKYFIDNLDNTSYNPDDFVNSIGEYNTFISESRENILSFGFKLKEEGYLSFGMSMNNLLTVKAASEVAYLLADYDKLSLDLFPLEVNDVTLETNNYLSIGFTYSRKINENLTLGASPHLNLNLLGIKSSSMNYIVEIDDENLDYITRVEGEAYLGLPVAINQDAINGSDVELDQIMPDNWTSDIGFSDLFRNKSMTLDLGATYNLAKWTFSASILNIGASGWKTNAYLLKGNEDEMHITEQGKISLSIPTKIWLGAKNQFSEKWSYALAINTTRYKSGTKGAATASLNGEIGRALSTSVSYTAGYDYNNIGLGLRLRFLPGTDLYFVTDNLMQMMNCKKAKKMSAAFGINISVGNDRYKKVKSDSTETEQPGILE